MRRSKGGERRKGEIRKGIEDLSCGRTCALTVATVVPEEDGHSLRGVELDPVGLVVHVLVVAGVGVAKDHQGPDFLGYRGFRYGLGSNIGYLCFRMAWQGGSGSSPMCFCRGCSIGCVCF